MVPSRPESEALPHVSCVRCGTTGQVGHGPGEPEDPVGTAQREGAAVERGVDACEQLGSGLRRSRSQVPGTSAFVPHGVPASLVLAATRAAATRAATVAVDSTSAPPARSTRDTGRTSTWTSTRSSSGPDSRAKYRRRTSGLHEHSSPLPIPRPHGHGLAASTSWKRAG